MDGLLSVYFVTVLLAFFLGILTGLLSIGLAILRQPEANLYGWACVVAGFYVLSWLITAALIGKGFIPTPSFYAVSLMPAYLGGIAILLSYAYRNSPPPEKGTFSLAFLFYLFLVVGVLITLCQILNAIDLDAGT